MPGVSRRGVVRRPFSGGDGGSPHCVAACEHTPQINPQLSLKNTRHVLMRRRQRIPTDRVQYARARDVQNAKVCMYIVRVHVQIDVHVHCV